MKDYPHKTEGRPDWETPQDLFDKLNDEFLFAVDVAASAENKKCGTYYDEECDAFKYSWGPGTCWMNPPYGKTITEWVKKAEWEARNNGATVVGLLPARTDTKWFHDYVLDKAEIRFIKGRLKFVGAKNSAPFPSIIVIWRATT